MQDLPDLGILQVGGAGLLLLVLILRNWRSEGGYGQLLRALREDAALARAETVELRKVLEATEKKCKDDIAALRRRLDDLERDR